MLYRGETQVFQVQMIPIRLPETNINSVNYLLEQFSYGWLFYFTLVTNISTSIKLVPNMYGCFNDGSIYHILRPHCRSFALSRLSLVNTLFKHAARRKNSELTLILLKHFLVIVGYAWNVINVFH